MSPEQARDATVDPQSDQFQLGTILYKMLADGKPFGSSTRTRARAGLFPLRPESARFRTSRGRATAAPSSTAGGTRPSCPRLADGAPVFPIPNVPAARGFVRGRHRWLPDGHGIAFVGVDGLGTALFVQDVVPGRDTAATRRKLAVFEPDVELHSFGLAPDTSVAVVASRQPTANLMEIDGLPPEVAPAGPRRP